MRRAMMVAMVLMVAACGDSTGTRIVQRNESDLMFLRARAGAPPLAQTTASFWAVRGQERELRMFFRPLPGATDSSEFLRFKISDGTTLTLPGGIPVALGDSVLITVVVVDPTRFIVDFQPSGLLFSRSEPAELRMRYAEADDDLDDDGDVDSEDDDIELQLRIWRQEGIGMPWFQTDGFAEVSLEEVEADITGFTRYAIAY